MDGGRQPLYKRGRDALRVARASRAPVDAVQQNKVQRVDASRQTSATRPHKYRASGFALSSIPRRTRPRPPPSPPNYHPLTPLTLSPMAPKPASTAGKAPASTASKAPAKTTSEGGAKAAKKTAKASAGAGGDGEKKKRKKGRKETYSSYIYKGAYFVYRSRIRK